MSANRSQSATLGSGHVVSRFRIYSLLASIVMVTAGSGCGSFLGSRNLSAVPASRVPREILSAELKNDFEDISLLRLRQDTPETYLLGPGDVLGIYIERVIGEEGVLPPVNYPEDSNLPPAVGLPVPVREDGSVALPIVDSINVGGMSLIEATDAIRKVYTEDNDILKGDEQFIVTMIKRRTVRVLVIREESGAIADVTKRGTGHVVDLPAYENDVLHALSETGGMPGTDAKNEILIYRGQFEDGVNADAVLSSVCLDNCQDPCFCNEAPLPDPPNVTRIPLRYNPGNPPIFSQDDILLNDGDIVIIRSRDNETFFTAGLLGGGEYPLPRDKDLDIIGAIATAGGPIGSFGSGIGGIGGNGGGAGGFGRGGSGQNGYCQPSQAIVIRELPCGDQITIKVDLNAALSGRGERILIKPNDVIMLRYTICEEVGNVLLNLIQFNFLFSGFSGNGF